MILNLQQLQEIKDYCYLILNAIIFIDNALPTPAIHIGLPELHDFLDSEGETGTVMLFIDKVFPLVEEDILVGSIPDMISQLNDMISKL